jgi:hypothetical protein
MQASDWISLVSLGVASLALWRSEVMRVLDLRTTIRKDQNSLRLELEQLDKKIPFGLQSRQRVCAATGQAGSAQAFREEVERDIPELVRLRTELANIPWIPLIGGAAIAADAAVAVHDLQVRVKQLTDKYTAAWAEDQAERERIWEGVLARSRDRNR